MANEEIDRLSQLPTSWTVVMKAHAESGAPDEMRQARQVLLARYETVARRYLIAALRHEANAADAAEDCLQELALRFMKGSFKGADPAKGRFRNYLKAVLLNLVTDFQRRHRFEPQPLGTLDPVAAGEPPADSGQEFQNIWRDELLASSLRILEESDRQSGQHLFTVLRHRMDNPDLRSEDLAGRLTEIVGKEVTANWVRKRLHFAREKFSQILLDEVRRSLDNPSDQDVEQELVEVGLFEYCRSALTR